MRKLLSLLAAMALFASGAFAQDAKKDPLQGVVRFMGRINPLLQAIYQDHMDVAREVYGKGWADVYEERNILARVIATYGSPALARAGDSAVISAMNKTAALVEIVAEKYPEGCEYFFTGNMPDWYSIPEVRDGRMADLRAKAYAYQDGKFRADRGVMAFDKQHVIMTQYLGMTADEVFKSLTAPIDVSDEDMCCKEAQ